MLLLLFLFAGPANTLDLSSFPGGLVPGEHLLLLDDQDGSLSFVQARDQLALLGQPWMAPGQPNLGYRRSALWVRVDLTNRFDTPAEWVAFTNFSQLSRVDFYYQTAAGEWVQRSAGSALPFRSRDRMHRSINFEFPVMPGQSQSIYFRIQTAGSLQFPLALGNEAYFIAESQRALFTAGLYFGLMLMIAIYSIAVWYSSYETGFLYFGLLVIAGSLYSLTTMGLAYQYLWPESPSWAGKATGIFALMASAAGTAFVRSFLNLHQFGEQLDNAARIFIGLSIAALIISLVLSPVIVNRVALALAFVMMAIVTIAGIMARRKQTRAASYFMSAWIIMLVGVLLELVQRLGVIVPPLLAYNGSQLASLVAITVLAIGLSDRLRAMMEGYKVAQEDLLKANQLKIDALQQADSVKEEFIANVSHELRTPLTGIIGLSEIMLADQSSNLNVPQRETLTLIKVSAQRLSSLVNDVIDFSSIKNGQLSLNRTDVDLKMISGVVVRMTRPLIGEKPIKLIENYPPGQIIVEGDADRLQQVLFNLVANAVKFTPHGTVTITVEVLELDVRVSVRDTGIGISEAEQKKIFTRFYQVDSAEARQAGGTGLGLSISQRLLELHGSEIVLRSTPGEGSLFYFDLPLKKTLPDHKRSAKVDGAKSSALSSGVSAGISPDVIAALQATSLPVERRRSGRMNDAGQAEQEQLADRNSRGGRILVVDDEYLNLRIVESHLSDSYQLTTALSGAEALEKLGRDKPDLIILDLMMPVMTGYQVCQIIRKRYDPDELPIVILTAKNRVEDMVKGLSLGANDYITKPFSKEELRVRIDKQFELLNLQQVKRDNQRLNWQLQRYEESEKRLRERERRLAALLDVTGDPLVAIDEAGIVIFLNSPAEHLLGIQASEVVQQSVNRVSDHLMKVSPAVSDALHFPFEESMISRQDSTEYFDYDLNGKTGRFCLLTMNQLDQEFYLLVFEQNILTEVVSGSMGDSNPEALSLPQIIAEINRNVERTQMLGEYLSQIKPEDLRSHRELVDELNNIDGLISKLSGALGAHTDDDGELHYREALVKVMQDCHFYWQKITGESIIDLAEKSRIWSVSIDNGRLRTRSMNRYLSLDKLPSNPRWRQVARTAYFVLSKVSQNEEARNALESSVARLQEIVEQKALN
jgi:two-component system, sensor histidine kinase LadS